MINLFLGVVLLLAAILNIFGVVEITKPYVFGFSLSVLFMSLVSYSEDPINEVQNKQSFSTVLKNIFLFCSILSFVLVPLTYNTKLVQEIINSIDDVTFLLLGIAISFLTLFSSKRTSYQLKKLIEMEKQNASNEKIKEILNRIENIKKE
ncbi:hypothetical protein OIN60_03100 [Paenibacillus sp. P96]|uniref:Uncharacterized protein n=1 Tax=Paenibacillus zeirhizosphaerae TaxID=2987519 RepID=A0ABT9FM02_9BACL|nr:hypothetical protein [Paenibacillus sp. P96]MDP4095778.1 hypothetical protein [Paenibacillus sp. P96]